MNATATLQEPEEVAAPGGTETPEGDATGSIVSTMFGRGLIYVVIWAVQIALTTLVSPILAHLVGPGPFGRVASAIALHQVLITIAVLGMDRAVTLLYAEEDAKAARELAMVSIAAVCLVTVVVSASGPLWAPAIGFGSFMHGVVLPATLWTAPAGIYYAMMALLRAQDRLAAFSVVSIVSAAGGQVLGIVLLVTWMRSVTVYCWAGVVTGAIAAVIGVATCRPRLRGLWQWQQAVDAVRLGLPLVVGSLAVFVLNSGDRLIVQARLGPAATGRYQIAYTVGSLAILLLAYVNQSWEPAIFKVRDEPTRWRVVAAARDQCLRLVVPLMVGLAIGAPIALRIAAPASFRPGDLDPVVAWVAATSVPFALSASAQRVLISLHRSRPVATSSVIAAIANIVLNFALVPVFGITGSAAATFLAFSLQLAILMVACRGVTATMPSSPRLITEVAAGLACCAVAPALPSSGARDLVIRGAVAAACAAWFGVLIRRAQRQRTTPEAGGLPRARASRARHRRRSSTLGRAVRGLRCSIGWPLARLFAIAGAVVATPGSVLARLVRRRRPAGVTSGAQAPRGGGPTHSGEQEQRSQIDELLDPTVDHSLRRLPGILRGSLRVVWSAGRRELAGTVGLQVLGALGLGLQLLVGRRLLQELLSAKTGAQFGHALPAVIGLVVAVAIVSAANVGRFEMQQLLGELVSRHALEKIVARACQADLMDFETPSFHDRLMRAIFNGTSRPLQLVTGLLGILSSLLAVVSVGFTLLLIQPLLFAIAVMAIVPVTLATVRAGRALYRFGWYQTERDRRRAYLQYLLTERDPAKEVRAYNLTDHLLGRYHDLYEQRISMLRDLVRSRAKQGLTGSLLTSVASGAAIALLIGMVATHRLSLAGAGAAAAALLLLGSQLQGLASGLGVIYESSLFVDDFMSFVDEPETLPATGRERPPETWRETSVEQVTFRYPGQEEPALRDVSMHIGQGEIVALVGENGSGKSTLAKLIAGLYRPTEGTVCWDGADLAAMDPHLRSAKTAVLFQDFVRYQMSLLENVTMGDWQRKDERGRAQQAAAAAGAGGIVARLEQGWDTQLGPQFVEGTDLSGGQWQRVALARALFRDAPLIVLDEPTAALDPRSEAELFEAVRELFRGRSVLLITHRFTSARLADRIYVMESGRIREEGDHEELLNLDGLYAELYGLQASAVLEAAGATHYGGGVAPVRRNTTSS